MSNKIQINLKTIEPLMRSELIQCLGFCILLASQVIVWVMAIFCYKTMMVINFPIFGTIFFLLAVLSIVTSLKNIFKFIEKE